RRRRRSSYQAAASAKAAGGSAVIGLACSACTEASRKSYRSPGEGVEQPCPRAGELGDRRAKCERGPRRSGRIEQAHSKRHVLRPVENGGRTGPPSEHDPNGGKPPAPAAPPNARGSNASPSDCRCVKQRKEE